MGGSQQIMSERELMPGRKHLRGVSARSRGSTSISRKVRSGPGGTRPGEGSSCANVLKRHKAEAKQGALNWKQVVERAGV